MNKAQLFLESVYERVAFTGCPFTRNCGLGLTWTPKVWFHGLAGNTPVVCARIGTISPGDGESAAGNDKK